MAYDKVVDSAELDAKLTAIADGFRLSRGTTQKYTLDEMAVLASEKATSVPDGTNVTFGNVDGNPAEREEAYAITSADLNELGAVAQRITKNSSLVTVGEIISILQLAEFLPVGQASTTWNASQLMIFASNSVGTLEE